MEPKNYDIIKKKVFPGVMITTLIGVLAAVVFLAPHLTTAGYNAEMSNNEDLPPRFL